VYHSHIRISELTIETRAEEIFEVTMTEEFFKILKTDTNHRSRQLREHKALKQISNCKKLKTKIKFSRSLRKKPLYL
jgi:hypothetical protein